MCWSQSSTGVGGGGVWSAIDPKEVDFIVKTEGYGEPMKDFKEVIQSETIRKVGVERDERLSEYFKSPMRN